MSGTKSRRAVNLGAQMREARKQYAPEMTVRSACDPLGVRHPTVSRWETGERRPTPEDVSAYMAVIGAPADLRDKLVALAKDTGPGPLLEFDEEPADRGPYAAMLEIERTAVEIVHVAPLLVPGLLQTPDYARAVMVGGEVPTDQLDMRVTVRIGRQGAITRRDPLNLTAFIAEPVLRAGLGGRDVMIHQLRHLLRVGELPNVDVRIIPMGVEWNPGWEGAFSIARFPEGAELRPVVQLENKISAIYLDSPAEVEPYEKAGRRAEEVAISSADSSELIASVINNKETTE